MTNKQLIFWLWFSRALSGPMISKLFRTKDLNVTYSYTNKKLKALIGSLLQVIIKYEWWCVPIEVIVQKLTGTTECFSSSASVCLLSHSLALCLCLASFFQHLFITVLNFYHPTLLLHSREKTWSKIPYFSNTKPLTDSCLYFLHDYFLHSQMLFPSRSKAVYPSLRRAPDSTS